MWGAMAAVALFGFPVHPIARAQVPEEHAQDGHIEDARIPMAGLAWEQWPSWSSRVLFFE